jgi:hypothetical protein
MADEYWANMFPSTTGNSDSLIALLYDNPKVTIIGSEAINGIDCYKIKIDADSEPLLTMFKEQGIIDPRFTGWVDKNTFHLLKSEHGFSSTRDGIVTEQSAVFFYSQINQVNITLPPEALNAPPPPAPPPPATPPQP